MPQRQLPRWSELRPLIGTGLGTRSPVERRLSAAHEIADLRAIARRRVPRAVFDYTEGAAEQEITLRRAREAFRRAEFRPRALQDVSKVDTSREMLGSRSDLPFVFAPTGFTRMMHHEGERAVVRVAERFGVPFGLSTMATTSIEDAAAAGPQARKWFQLYVWKDRGAGAELVSRAAESGFEALILTVDTAVAGARLRDARHGLTIPPSLTPRTIADAALHPAWWFNLLTTEPLRYATLAGWHGTLADMVNKMFDPSVTIDDLAWLRSMWPGPLIVKGIQNEQDARLVADHGADAVVVSCHGGRQLDRAPVPLELLPAVLDAVGGDAEVYLDTGILTGADILAAVAMGARGCLIGRAFLYGLMAGGERGVERAARILRAEITRTLQLMGVRAVDELTPGHVRLRQA
ncbi:MAG: alpha-hydroxy-acid oxidizing protein [Nocardiopsaceae bacterium]|jgi:L-lactate dehydrogenase (cytochrome)|nr:alpha-hydroxy-acid oxidizing protein [Nocardiopsaceae bacterium]